MATPGISPKTSPRPSPRRPTPADNVKLAANKICISPGTILCCVMPRMISRLAFYRRCPGRLADVRAAALMRGWPASEFPLVPNGARLITGLMLHDSKVAVGRAPHVSIDGAFCAPFPSLRFQGETLFKDSYRRRGLLTECSGIRPRWCQKGQGPWSRLVLPICKGIFGPGSPAPASPRRFSPCERFQGRSKSGVFGVPVSRSAGR